MKKWLLILMLFAAPVWVSAGWEVAPNGDIPDRPLKYISRDPNIPTRAPVGYPCESDVISQIAGTPAAWVYMRDGFDLAAVCIPTAAEPPVIDPTPPPAASVTISVTYTNPPPKYYTDDNGGQIPISRDNVISYTRLQNGAAWGPWVRRVHDTSGAFSIAESVADLYEMKTAYSNSFDEGPQSPAIPFK